MQCHLRHTKESTLVLLILSREWKPGVEVILRETPMQSSAVITRFNTTWYCTHLCRNWGRVSIRVWIPKRHCTHRASYGMYFGRIWEKIDRVITAPHCILKCFTDPSHLLMSAPNIVHDRQWYSHWSIDVAMRLSDVSDLVRCGYACPSSFIWWCDKL